MTSFLHSNDSAPAFHHLLSLVAASGRGALGVGRGVVSLARKTPQGVGAVYSYTANNPGTALAFLATAACAGLAAHYETPYAAIIAAATGLGASFTLAKRKTGDSYAPVIGYAAACFVTAVAMTSIYKSYLDDESTPREDVANIVQGACPQDLAVAAASHRQIPLARWTKIPFTQLGKSYDITIKKIDPPTARNGRPQITASITYSYKSLWTDSVQNVTGTVSVPEKMPGTPCYPLRASYEVTLR
jgi:hypothetical protein